MKLELRRVGFEDGLYLWDSEKQEYPENKEILGYISSLITERDNTRAALDMATAMFTDEHAKHLAAQKELEQMRGIVATLADDACDCTIVNHSSVCHLVELLTPEQMKVVENV
jgi:hypothetical protein